MLWGVNFFTNSNKVKNKKKKKKKKEEKKKKRKKRRKKKKEYSLNCRLHNFIYIIITFIVSFTGLLQESF